MMLEVFLMVRARRNALSTVLFAAIGVVFAACGQPTVGGKCTPGKGACVDAKSGLFCGADRTYKAMSCGGPNGCKLQGANVFCDNDVAIAGDGCDTPGDGACTSDGKTLLVCQAEKFALIDTCKGPGHCKVKGDTFSCDNDIADVGDPCSNKGNYACTSDKTMALQCADGKYGPIQTCRGPKACSVVRDKSNPKVVDIDCDFSVAAENDPCNFPGNESCSADKRTRLTCRGKKYTDATACTGPDGCAVRVNGKSATVTCDNRVPEAERKGGRRRRR